MKHFTFHMRGVQCSFLQNGNTVSTLSTTEAISHVRLLSSGIYLVLTEKLKFSLCLMSNDLNLDLNGHVLLPSSIFARRALDQSIKL